MAKNLILVDTNVLIEVFRGNKETKKELDAIEGRIAISVITAMELYKGCKTNKRKAELTEQLKAYKIIHIDNLISEKAIQLFTQYISANQDMYIADCLIAATNIIHKTKLYTNNKSDFSFIKSVVFYNT